MLRLRKNIILSAVLALILAALLPISGCEERNMDHSTPINSYEQISQEEAKRIMDSDSDAIIVDVRRADEYASGHIPGAVCIPNETIEETAGKLLPDRDRLILVYCRSGNRSKQAAEKLCKLGYTNVKEFGGILTWEYDVESDQTK